MDLYPQMAEETEVLSILKDIPLDRCSEETEFISRKRALRAPEGKAFKVEGSFYIERDTSGGGVDMPWESRELFLSQDHKSHWFDDFNDYLKEADGDQNEALRLMEAEEGVSYPDFFIGKWLAIDTDEMGNRRLTLRGHVRASVEKGVAMWQGSESFPEYGEEEPLEFRSKNGDELLLFGSEIFAFWEQEYVRLRTDLGRITLSLVANEESDRELYISPEQISRDLFLPHQKDPTDTLDRWKATHQDYLEFRYQRKFSDEEIVRFVRNMGVPLFDDPLRDFKFIHEPPGEELIVSGTASTDSQRRIIVRKNYSTEEWLASAGVAKPKRQ